MENRLIKYESEIVKRVEAAINLTNKLTRSSQERWLELYDRAKYHYDCMAKEELVQFIKGNFWYFLSAIIQKERIKDYCATNEISKETLERIRSTKNKFEFPRCSYRRGRIEGELFE